MKNAILALAATTLAVTANAQLTIGGKAGMNYSIYGTAIDPEPKEKPEAGTGIGFHVGGYLEFLFAENLAIRPELLYSARKTSEKETTSSSVSNLLTTVSTKTESDNDQTLSYIELPILLSYKAGDNLSFQVGPGLGFLMSAKTKSESTTTTTTTNNVSGTSSTSTSSGSGESDSKEGLRGLEIGAVAGLCYELESGLSFGLRYWRGLSTLNEETDLNSVTVKTRANIFQVSIGYAFMKD